MTAQPTVYSDNATTILLAGVGGQGTILAADLLAKTAMANGLQVKLSEIHGMSQRGGAVTTVVRIGEKVNSMVCCEGCADYLLSFETTEALRNIQFLKKDGMLLVNDESIKPLPVLTGKAITMRIWFPQPVLLVSPAPPSARTWFFWVPSPQVCPSPLKAGKSRSGQRFLPKPSISTSRHSMLEWNASRNRFLRTDG